MLDYQILYSEFMVLLLACFINSYRKIPKDKGEKSLENLEQIAAFLKQNGGNHTSHLIFLKDKEIYWAVQQKVLIVYKRIGNRLVVLGDPIGDDSNLYEAIKEFCDLSEQKGLIPVFYQVSPENMHYYHEFGYRFMKLGEEGMVNLGRYSLEGKQNAKLRTRFNKFERNSFTFHVFYPPYNEEILTELKRISDSWLGKQKEKGFSVVSFSEEYVSRFPTALLYDGNGKIIAFSTLATDYKNNISIDLMRKSSNSPHGTMDVLFIHILKWAKEHGYETCSLGMAPLSNVGHSKHAQTVERLVRLAFLNGNSLYNFKGLKEFKNKFASSWAPKYFAYKKAFLPFLLIQLILLINQQPNFKYTVSEKMKYLIKKVG